MLKPIIRILALFALAMALITAVLDITRSIADSTLVMTSFGVDWQNFAPASLNQAHDIVKQYLPPQIWDPIIIQILKVPTWGIFGVIWFLLSMLGRRKKSRWQDRYSA